jgi:hypothetical protein
MAKMNTVKHRNKRACCSSRSQKPMLLVNLTYGMRAE